MPAFLDACPICGKPSAPGRVHPFCSQRCAQVDLGRWFTGIYALPASQDREDEANVTTEPDET